MKSLKEMQKMMTKKEVAAVIEQQAKKWSTSKAFMNLDDSHCRVAFRRSQKAYKRNLAKLFPWMDGRDLTYVACETLRVSSIIQIGSIIKE